MDTRAGGNTHVAKKESIVKKGSIFRKVLSVLGIIAFMVIVAFSVSKLLSGNTIAAEDARIKLIHDKSVEIADLRVLVMESKESIVSLEDQLNSEKLKYSSYKVNIEVIDKEIIELQNKNIENKGEIDVSGLVMEAPQPIKTETTVLN